MAVERIIRGINSKALWYKDQSDYSWLGENELVADVLRDLRTDKGTLSVYMVNDDEKDYRRAIAALACKRNSLQNYDYVQAPYHIIREYFAVSRTLGETPDNGVNMWHLDIVELTPAKLARLAYIFGKGKLSVQRMRKRDVIDTIQDNLNKKLIDRDRIHDDLKSKFSSA